MLAKDKLQHIGVGILTGAPCMVLPDVAVGFVAFGGSVIGILKECYDKDHPEKHTSDPYDALATAVGAAFGSIMFNIIGGAF